MVARRESNDTICALLGGHLQRTIACTAELEWPGPLQILCHDPNARAGHAIERFTFEQGGGDDGGPDSDEGGLNV